MRSPGANYSNIGEKIGNTTRKKETFAGFEPSTNQDEDDQVNTELLLSQSSNKNFLHIMLLSFEIGFLGVVLEAFEECTFLFALALCK